MKQNTKKTTRLAFINSDWLDFQNKPAVAEGLFIECFLTFPHRLYAKQFLHERPPFFPSRLFPFFKRFAKSYAFCMRLPVYRIVAFILTHK